MSYLFAFVFFIILTSIVLIYAVIVLHIIEIFLYLYSKTPHVDETETITGMSDFQIRFGRLWNKAKQVELFKRALKRKRNRMLLVLFVAFLFVKVFQYGSENFNEQSRYPAAKAYYVVGSIANMYSKTIAMAGSPDALWIYPFYQSFEWMKRAMYALGVQYIPSTDPERALWRYEWFYYPYVEKFHQHWGVGKGWQSREGASIFKEMLDDLWTIIEATNTQTFADKNREREARMDMPTLVKYTYLHNKYSLPFNPSRKVGYILKTDPEYIRRNHLLYQWLKDLAKIYSLPSMTEDISKAPQVEAIRQSILLFVMEQQMSMDIYARTFSCQSEVVRHYTWLRNLYFSDQSPIFMKLISDGMGRRVYEMRDASMDNISAEYVRQMLKEFCNVTVLGVSPESHPYEGGMRGFYQDLTSEQRVFGREIKILKEMNQ